MIDYVNAAQSYTTLDPDTLTVVWARRFAEYKRAGLLASDLARLARILDNPERPVQLVISGKAHPRDEGGKRVLQALLGQLQSDAAIKHHVAFIPDYSVEVARYLVGGADVWLNTPRKPLEASGTSGMKSSDNGGIQLTVRDGWAAEVDWWGIGWGIEGRNDESDAAQMYEYLEEGIIPSFYDRDADGTASRWISMVKNTMILTLSQYSARRMLVDYVFKLYLPLLEKQQAVLAH
jgi:starch phosphorylase